MSVRGDFFTGVRYVRSERVVLVLLAVSLVVTLTGRNWQQLAPVFVRDVFGSGEGGLGVLYTAAGVGAVLGATFLVVASSTRRRAPIFAAGLLLAFTATLGFAFSPSLEVAIVTVLLVGLGLQITETTTQTVLLVETPEHMRGRVMSLSSLLWGLQPLGVLVAGVAADVLSPQVAIAGGVVVAGVLLASLYARSSRIWASF